MIHANDATDLIFKHLGKSLRARHSVFVGYLMMRVADALGEDSALWQVTGLCHDLDFVATQSDRSRHGMQTAEWLKDDLPDDALLAIQSHDHRTGVQANTRLADALKMADAVAVGEMDVGRDAMLAALSSPEPELSLNMVLSQRSYLTGLILAPSQRLSISPTAIAELCRGAPPQ